MRTGQRNAPKDVVVEFPDDDYRSKELISATILLETDIFSKMTIPNLTLVKKEPRFVGVVERLLERRPCSIISLHFAMLTYAGRDAVIESVIICPYLLYSVGNAR